MKKGSGPIAKNNGWEMEKFCLCLLDLQREELLAMSALFFFFHFISSNFACVVF